MVVGFLLYSAGKFPSVSNHHIMELFFCIGFLCAWLKLIIKRQSLTLNKDDLYQLVAPIGRSLLIIMYIYGTFHKINSDFLNPEVSCAVHLWKHFHYMPAWMLEAKWIHWATIYGTLIIEGLALILLCFARTSYYGMVMGMLFHFLIGTNGAHTLVNYSTLSISLHVLFLAPDALNRFYQSNLYTRLHKPLLWWYGYAFILCFSALYFIHQWPLIGRLVLWCFIGGSWILFAILYGKKQSYHSRTTIGYLWPKSIVGAILIIGFFFNGLNPYIGLKTESAIAMFSNLQTENGQTNHLFFDKPPYLFDFQNDIVVMTHTTDPVMGNFFIGPNIAITYSQMKNWFSQHPDNGVVYWDESGKQHIIENIRNHPDLSKPYPWLLQKWLYFRPVNLTTPRPCTH